MPGVDVQGVGRCCASIAKFIFERIVASRTVIMTVRKMGEFASSGELALFFTAIASAAEEPGDILGGFARLDELDGPEAATLEFFCGPDRSHILSPS